MKNIIFLSGLPRSGSTLLTSILCQNPKFYFDGNSALCQLMWDMHISCEINAREQLSASKKLNIQNNLVSSISNIYYKDVENKFIIDKCRSWTLPDNIYLIEQYLKKDFKMIVMTRPIIDIVKSFIYINNLNGIYNSEIDLLNPNSEPIMRSLNGVRYAKQNNQGQFLFIEYDDLIESPEKNINKIYEFLEIKKIKHNFLNIENKSLEDDEVYNLKGLHHVRKFIKKNDYNILLEKSLEEKCLSIKY